MKLMPFLTASLSVATELSVVLGDELLPFGQELDAWDYLMPFEVIANFDVDINLFQEETGLIETDLSGVLLCLQLDCPSSGWRGFFNVPLTTGRRVPVRGAVPALMAAEWLEARALILLGHSLPASEQRTATLKGSRLYEGPTVRLQLEGNRGSFPVDAFSFETVGLPGGAPWHLQVVADDLDVPFMRAVRLRINTSHPASSALPGTDRSDLTEWLFHDTLVQLIIACERIAGDSGFGLSEEGSLGAILNDLCEAQLGMSSTEAFAGLREDPTEFLTQVKGRMSLLAGTK